jgi:hypothetical protein
VSRALAGASLGVFCELLQLFLAAPFLPSFFGLKNKTWHNSQKASPNIIAKIERVERLIVDFTLTHGFTPVTEISIDDRLGSITGIKQILNFSHFPLESTVRNEPVIDLHELNRWWRSRAIPSSRDSVWNVLNVLKLTETTSLLVKSLGLSLSDHYWINPVATPVDWTDVNFFQNNFSFDLGNILFNKEINHQKINFMSPDSSTGGVLPKKWTIVNGERILLKGCNRPYFQEPINEVCATALMTELEIDHVEYSLSVFKNRPCSSCACFASTNKELIHASAIAKHFSAEIANKGADLFDLIKNGCGELGIPDFQSFINKLLTVDFLINNEDRHLFNFGFLRNPVSLEWISAAPVYDSGLSLFYNSASNNIGENEDTVSKPFRNNHHEQIRLVNDFSWLNYKKLKTAPELLYQIIENYFLKYNVSENPKGRAEAIAEFLKKRVQSLEKIANLKPQTQSRTRF